MEKLLKAKIQELEDRIICINRICKILKYVDYEIELIELRYALEILKELQEASDGVPV